MILRVFINELLKDIPSNSCFSDIFALFDLDGDVHILNGHQIVDTDPALSEYDRVTVFRKGRIPCERDLEVFIRARHTPGVHQKVSTAKVAIAGLGGLGSNVAIALARIGCGHLILIDYDIVEPTNINRQHYNLTHIGMKKCVALKDQIKDINPFISIEIKDEKITRSNLYSMFKDIDIIVEAFDNPMTKADIIEGLIISFPKTPIVASSGMTGYYSNNLISSTRVTSNLYVVGDGINEAKPNDGLMAPRVLIAAGHQANMVLRIIMNEREV